jgi:hypothetical protein
MRHTWQPSQLRITVDRAARCCQGKGKVRLWGKTWIAGMSVSVAWMLRLVNGDEKSNDKEED